MEGNYKLSSGLFAELHGKFFYVLNQVSCAQNYGILSWLHFVDLKLTGGFVKEWDKYVDSLNRARIFLLDSSDRLVWSYNKANGEVSAKMAYQFLWEEA